MKTKIAVLILTLFMTAPTFAQDKPKDPSNQDSGILSLERQIILKDHSKEETISINIDKEVKAFMLSVQTQVMEGKLTVEIYDPNQNKEGAFSVGTQLNSSIEELAKGQINIELFDPQKGTWIIRIKPEKAYGDINISSLTSYN